MAATEKGWRRESWDWNWDWDWDWVARQMAVVVVEEVEVQTMGRHHIPAAEVVAPWVGSWVGLHGSGVLGDLI